VIKENFTKLIFKCAKYGRQDVKATNPNPTALND